MSIKKNNIYKKPFTDSNRDFCYIKFEDFFSKTVNTIREVLNDRRVYKKIIFDLNHNCGGDIDGCAKLLDLLVEADKKIFELTYANKSIVYRSTDIEKVVYGEIELLTSQYTMSAAEIFTLVLCKFCNAKNINLDGAMYNKQTGQTTFVYRGKGYCQFKFNSFYWRVL